MSLYWTGPGERAGTASRALPFQSWDFLGPSSSDDYVSNSPELLTAFLLQSLKRC
jgi:hypothetical protein